MSDTMAPPESSSPAKAATKSVTTKKTAAEEYGSGIGARWKPRKPVKKILDTAALQDLLPRRRHGPTRGGEFDIHSNSVSEKSLDKEEVSFHAPKKAKTRHGKIHRQPLTSKQGGAAKIKATGAKTSKTSRTTKASRLSKTYSRRSSDQENDARTLEEGEPAGDGSNPIEVSRRAEAPFKTSKELKQLAEKFAEVDKWEMEFEVVTASSSSPRDAR